MCHPETILTAKRLDELHTGAFFTSQFYFSFSFPLVSEISSSSPSSKMTKIINLQIKLIYVQARSLLSPDVRPSVRPSIGPSVTFDPFQTSLEQKLICFRQKPCSARLRSAVLNVAALISVSLAFSPTSVEVARSRVVVCPFTPQLSLLLINRRRRDDTLS